MEIDTRFLTIHPRTALWWEQREQCSKCKHLERVDIKQRRASWGQSGGQMSCLATGTAEKRIPCITAREDSMVCGPEARRFEEA